ncbi:hypothetical protein DCAR_0102059 [Daucus carota subsp. sativus]|uniref:Uncharacterized protein n=1 Tax=Daucus carota subsp. sativus TaxID=79200 RepID=A0A166GUK9_DAUCS|nr:hypothetical protein DCAR_0102059 [Daucus carota subsp. sativus]
MEKDMKQAAANTFATTPKSGWNSPIPWLFGGLALMLGLILVALLILIFSYRRRNPPPSTAEIKMVKSSATVVQPDFVPVVVIMAGEDKPTYVATPISSNDCNLCNEV